jgi:hypothetical protein
MGRTSCVQDFSLGGNEHLSIERTKRREESQGANQPLADCAAPQNPARWQNPVYCRGALCPDSAVIIFCSFPE